MSPVMIAFAFAPIRVKNIFIWRSVAFCASSKMINALSAYGHAYMPGERSRSFLCSYNTPACPQGSYHPVHHIVDAGKDRSFLSGHRAKTKAFTRLNSRTRKNDLFTCLFFNARTASATAVYVLPVPAGPMAKTISFFLPVAPAFFWLAVRARTLFPLGPKTKMSLGLRSIK